jgi:hypothetical protein
LVGGQDPPLLFGMNASGWYSTGFAGSPFDTPGVGAGQQPPEGPVLGEAVVTTSGASSIPVQPTAVIGAYDSNVPAQSALYAGHELFSGVSQIGETGFGHGRPQGGFPA